MTDTNEPQDENYFSEESATFGDRVSAARQAAGLSQNALSHKLGVKLKTIRGWEDDLAEPRANKLQMLAGVLNVSLVWLLTGEGAGVSSDWDAQATPDTGLSEAIAELRAIRLENRRLCERMVKLERSLTKI